MFPDSLRNAVPRIYEGKTYSAKEHYSDSSTYIFVPDYFNKTRPFQFVLWFHGWGNNIDSALAQYKLQQQFYAAHLNAIFIFPEGPKNSPDSYAGKFEKPDTFNFFMKDVNTFLLKEKIITKNIIPELIYAGHSGAYRAIAYLLLHSSFRCKAILLFDALYAEQEKFAMYLQQHSNCKMIDIYTDNGGTLQNSKNLAIDMLAWKWKFIDKEEEDCTANDLKNNRIIFLHSKKQHNDVVTSYNNFQRFLECLK
ncbi:hypothetical protein GALL_95010 [mine drainage metagenome]|uniref:Alpha/beta hydrolase family protein n=1 Tax=mine drainage metagenome TaxID=410659 RepID=A0A1J5SWD3_9ZZZZ